MIEWYMARFETPTTSTPGVLYDENRKFLCYTLEDAIRKEKIYSETAIPSGRYQLDYTYSGRFGRMLPLLINTPLFTSIRIHGGSSAQDTAGCILVGKEKAMQISGGVATWYVRRSQEALNEIVIPKFEAAFNKGPMFLNILGGYQASEMKLAA